ncbi:MAG TPA: HEAT repeat domain-containing protein [Acidimicrobiales bacterium]|nr:HEAT repeat domain-containing protein [Acidimicrobiales bacterium]
MPRPAEPSPNSGAPTSGAATPCDSEADRRRAAAAAGHNRDQRAARDALADGSGAVRATGLGALARMGALRDDDLLAAAGDPDPRVRARSAELAPDNMEPHDASVLLVAALEDREPSVVEAACFALGELGPRGGNRAGAVGALAAVVRNHREPLCREAAVAALGAIGDPTGLPAILEATGDKPAVRRRAVIALAPFSGEAVEAALDGALDDRDWQVRQAAEDLTGQRAQRP